MPGARIAVLGVGRRRRECWLHWQAFGRRSSAARRVPGAAEIRNRSSSAVGLLDYYRQFEGLSDDEVNAELRRKAAEQRQRALARVDPIDLSQTTWPELPPHTVVNAVTYISRRGLHRYLDPHAGELRSELAALHGVADEQVVVGNGAAQLLAATAHALMEPDDELVTPWPSYPLYPVMARRARGRAMPVPGFAAEAIVRALNQRTRIVALCNPNDPTGELLSTAELDELLGMLPERVVVLLDEALAHYAERPLDETLPLLERHPRRLRNRRARRRAAARAPRARAGAQRARPGRRARGAARHAPGAEPADRGGPRRAQPAG